MPVKIEIWHENAESILAEVGTLANGLLRPQHAPGRPDYEHLKADAEARQRGENLDGSPRRETIAVEATETPGQAPVGQDPTPPVAEQPAEPKKRAGRKPKAETDAQQISTNPENRVGPEDDPAVDAQDAADEAAEVEAEKAETGVTYTREDVKHTLGKYVHKYGMAAVQEDGAKLLDEVCGVTKLSGIPDDPEVFAKVIAKIEEALVKNPFNRTPETAAT